MEDGLKIKLYTVTLDCPEPLKLAKFYAALLGWEIVFSDEEYACVGAPGARQGSYPGVMFQRNAAYRPPVWPDAPEAQQQMAHLDFAVNDLEKAVEYAVRCGAADGRDEMMGDEKKSMKRTKIICTMGPNSDKPGLLEGLVEAGMDVARFNFSHGDHAEHKLRMDRLKAIREEKKIPVAILLDTKGPEIRTGLLEAGRKVSLEEGDTLVLTTEEIVGNAQKVSIS